MFTEFLRTASYIPYYYLYYETFAGLSREKAVGKDNFVTNYKSSSQKRRSFSCRICG